MMPMVTLVFDPTTNDPNRIAQRHVSRETAKGITADDVIHEAWQHRHDFVPQAITTRTWAAPPRLVSDISYDSAIVGSASEAEVMEALIKAGQR
jgi:hypothetical protein